MENQKKVGFLRNPKVYPGSEVFVPFEEKTPFLERLGANINNGLIGLFRFLH